MLYPAGYLITDVVDQPNNARALRPIRIPYKEMRHLYRDEIIERFTSLAGSTSRHLELQSALIAGDPHGIQGSLEKIAHDTASTFYLISENSFHMLLLGLCFGKAGYADPVSNREAGYGRFDIRIDPVEVASESLESFGSASKRPRITIEPKYLARGNSNNGSEREQLTACARQALLQIEENEYNSGNLPTCASGRMRWGIAFSGKHVAATCPHLP